MSAKSTSRLLLGAGLTAAAAGWALAPRTFSDKQRHYVPAVPDAWYAHRGLHDAGSGLTVQYAATSGDYVALARRMAMKAGYGTPECTGPIAPENSLASFAAACEAGYGIELDIQLTVDEQVVVVHDADLLRVAGDPRRIEDLTYDELTRIPLFPSPCKPGSAKARPLPGSEEMPALVTTPDHAPKGYYQHVPLLSDVLALVNGRVPLIIEYKIDGFGWDERCETLMDKADTLLSDYHGTYVVESFHPGAMRWYKEHRPEVCRGQLAEASRFELSDIRKWAAGTLLFDWLSRPDFIAYDWRGGNTLPVRLACAMGASAVSWTVRSRDELAQCDDWFDQHIFESFIPER